MSRAFTAGGPGGPSATERASVVEVELGELKSVLGDAHVEPQGVEEVRGVAAGPFEDRGINR